MKRRIENNDINTKRLLSIKELCDYIGMGKTLARSYADGIGATKRYGKRLLFDKHIIDQDIDKGGEVL